MSIVSLLIPFVAAYIWYAWKSINAKKIDEDEFNRKYKDLVQSEPKNLFLLHFIFSLEAII